MVLCSCSLKCSLFVFFIATCNVSGKNHLERTLIMTSFCLYISDQLDGVKLTLDCAQAQFMTSERAVISLKGGELYVLSLIVDGSRGVKGSHYSYGYRL